MYATWERVYVFMSIGRKVEGTFTQECAAGSPEQSSPMKFKRLTEDSSTKTWGLAL